MSDYTRSLDGGVALVTGAAQRIGAEVVRTLHREGMQVALHYRRSKAAAEALRDELNGDRPDSVAIFEADLMQCGRLPRLVDKVIGRFGRLDALVNNASSFYPTPPGSITEAQWDDLVGTNLKAPLFLVQAAAPHLAACGGCVVNIADIHGSRPLKDHTVYSVAKAGVLMLTKALARDLGPAVRVNAVAPGAILWPEQELDEVTKQRIITRTALKRQGSPADVARAILFLIRDAGYVTGQTISVDGGRMLTG